MRAAAAAAVLLLVLGVAADAAGTVLLERVAAQRAAEAFDAPVDVEITLSGWPVTVRALTGSVPRVDVRATDVPLTEGGAVLSRVEAFLTDVDVRRAGDAAAAGDLPPASGGGWTAELDEADLQAALPGAAGVRLGDGVVTVTVGGMTLDAAVAAEGGRLAVRPTASGLGWARVEIGLEELPGTPYVERAGVEPGVVRLGGRLSPPPVDTVSMASSFALPGPGG